MPECCVNTSLFLIAELRPANFSDAFWGQKIVSILTEQCINHLAPTFNSIGLKIHTLPRHGLVTIQIAWHILCSIRFWCGFICQGVFFLPAQFCKAVDFTVALLYPNFKLQYLMNYSSNFNNFCRFQLLAVCTTLL